MRHNSYMATTNNLPSSYQQLQTKAVPVRVNKLAIESLDDKPQVSSALCPKRNLLSLHLSNFPLVKSFTVLSLSTLNY